MNESEKSDRDVKAEKPLTSLKKIYYIKDYLTLTIYYLFEEKKTLDGRKSNW